ncbi:GTP-binding protein [Candidatus Woesearchaeota archaeon]|nr:GTP-binding protein [Candidatus Woesearchaeota archaeon]
METQTQTGANALEKEQMKIVVVGHVDHGKSTVIGRLLADTDSLPERKLEEIQERCKKESKVFEYAFLLDALKDEQSQGITIDSARCHFKTDKRDYLIIDAPGHIEFLKNMISGAARAEAAVLVIDADEGVQENSRRHGYMLSMLNINQVVVCVNKMDLVDYKKEVFEAIRDEYLEFLKKIGIEPMDFIPVSALKGDNISAKSEKLAWHQGPTILQALDRFQKQESKKNKPFRMPVQGIYKFTGFGDNRRIVAGRIESGSIKAGDNVVFMPSNKRSSVKTVEEFNSPGKEKAEAGCSAGFTLTEQIYVNRGDIMCREDEELPAVSSVIKTNIFWMGKAPMHMNKEYILKLGTSKVPVRIKKILKVLDASNLKDDTKDMIERHEIAECLLECPSPIAFDLSDKIEATGRFVIVDGYDICGGGIISECIEDSQSKIREQVFLREKRWDHSMISFNQRVMMYGQVPKLVLLTGKTGVDKKTTAKQLEKSLFEKGRKIYFLGIGNLLRGLDSDIEKEKRQEHIRRLGEVAHILMDAGLITIATASDLSNEELKRLQTLTTRDEMIIISIGDRIISDELVDLTLEEDADTSRNVEVILDLLRFKKVIFGL